MGPIQALRAESRDNESSVPYNCIQTLGMSLRSGLLHNARVKL
jgi:hypothetical protein